MGKSRDVGMLPAMTFEAQAAQGNAEGEQVSKGRISAGLACVLVSHRFIGLSIHPMSHPCSCPRPPWGTHNISNGRAPNVVPLLHLVWLVREHVHLGRRHHVADMVSELPWFDSQSC